MRIVVDGRDFLGNELIVRFVGVTSYGEEINLSAKYDSELKMVECSGAYSSRNNARYYVEVAEYFKAMLDLEGSDRLRGVFNRVDDIEKSYDKENELLYKTLEDIRINIKDTKDEISTINEEIKGLNAQMSQLKKSLKRCTKQSSIEDRQKEIDELKLYIEARECKVRQRLNELNKKLIVLKIEEVQAQRDIDRNYYSCKEAIKIEISQ